jgi:hypothetical protein
MDLIRTGKYLDILSPEVKTNCLTHTISEATMPVLPIPRDEVDSWGIQQNPGY